MKILQLITQNQLRGAEVFAAQLSDMLAARGHEVVLASLLGGEQMLSTGPGVRQVALGKPEPGRGPVSLRTWQSLRRLVREFHPDVVQANGSETLKYAALLRMTKPSLPAIYRNISVMSMWSGSRFKRLLVGIALRRMSHVASVTKIGKGDLMSRFGVRADRVSVLPIGVKGPTELSTQDSKKARADLRRRFGIPEDCPLVVHVGSFTPEKNHAELLEAFARVLAVFPSAYLVLVGDGALRPQIEALARDKRLTGRVLLAGAVSDGAGMIAAADVLALPSLREGLPGVILEAQAAGVAVIAYSVGGVPEVIEDGVTGLLVAARDVEGLATGLARLLGDSALRRRLGAEARLRIADNYSLEDVVDRFEEVYDLVTERR